MFVKRRRNLNFNNNDSFLNLNYDKVAAGVIVADKNDQNGNNNNIINNNSSNGNGEVCN